MFFHSNRYKFLTLKFRFSDSFAFKIKTLVKDSLFDLVNRRSEKAFLDGKIDIPCLRIWRNALPIGRNARGGLLVPEA